MAREGKPPQDGDRTPQQPRIRKPYASPKLVRYGDVRDLTQGAGNTNNEGSPGQMMS